MVLGSKRRKLKKIEKETEIELINDAFRKRNLLDRLQIINKHIAEQERVLVQWKNDISIMGKVIAEGKELKRLIREQEILTKKLEKFEHIDEVLMNKLIKIAKKGRR